LRIHGGYIEKANHQAKDRKDPGNPSHVYDEQSSLSSARLYGGRLAEVNG
jgi:hypothetical protein